MSSDTSKPVPVQVVVEFHGDPPSALGDLAAGHPDEVELIESKGFAASDYTVQVLFVAAAGGIVRSIAAIVRAHIESRQHVSIKVDGVEIQGLDADGAVKVLEELTNRAQPLDEQQI